MTGSFVSFSLIVVYFHFLHFSVAFRATCRESDNCKSIFCYRNWPVRLFSFSFDILHTKVFGENNILRSPKVPMRHKQFFPNSSGCQRSTTPPFKCFLYLLKAAQKLTRQDKFAEKPLRVFDLLYCHFVMQEIFSVKDKFPCEKLQHVKSFCLLNRIIVKWIS